MKDSRSDLNRLLGGLLLFCAVAAWCYVQNEHSTIVESTNTAVDAAQTTVSEKTAVQKKDDAFSTKDIIKNMAYFVEAKNVKAIAELLADIPAAQLREVVRSIITDSSISLSAPDKLRLVLAVIKNYSSVRDAYVGLFDLIVEHPEFNNFSPIYFAAAHGHSDLIPLLATLAEEKKVKNPGLSDLIVHAVYKGLQHAIENNNVVALTNIFAQKVNISPAQASELLWQAVSQKKNPDFVQILVDHGADSNVVKNGYSLLAQAVMSGNVALVKAVAQAHPQPNINAMHDAAVGTPLQLAIQHGFADIDQYLRSQGARE